MSTVTESVNTSRKKCTCICTLRSQMLYILIIIITFQVECQRHPNCTSFTFSRRVYNVSCLLKNGKGNRNSIPSILLVHFYKRLFFQTLIFVKNVPISGSRNQCSGHVWTKILPKRFHLLSL